MQFYKHQTEALNLTENFNRCAYYLDMGLGKTFVGAEKLERLKSDANIIVCQKSKIDDWIEHFKKYYGGMIFNLTDKKQLQSFMLEYAKLCKLSDMGLRHPNTLNPIEVQEFLHVEALRTIQS